MSDVVQLEVLAARQKVNLLRERKTLKDNNGLAFYQPHKKQDMFHHAGDAKRRYVRTGNRFGKSDMGAAEDCAFSLGYRPWYPKGHPAYDIGIPKHSTKGCIIVQDWDKAHEIFTNPEPGKSRGKLFKFLPKDAIVSSKKGRSGTGIAEIIIKSVHGGHSTIHLETVRSYIQNPMGLESSDWDWIHIDEPCPQAMWVAVSRGLIDRAGSAWFTCTPVTEAWINDYFIPRSLTRATFNTPYEDESVGKWVITGSSHDNPHINKEALEQFEGDISEEERACRILGIPMALSGLVYKDFDVTKHVYGPGHKIDCPSGWEDSQTPPKNYTIRTFIDPHPRTPHAVLHFATAPTGQTFIFREMFRPGLISEITEHIEAQVEGYFVEDFLCDPIAWIENPITGTCMADEFYACNLPVEPAPKDLTYGILKTQAKFRERDEHGNPMIFVHSSCEEFLFEIDRYIWQREKEKPVDKDDHMMENLYRAVLTGLTYKSTEAYIPRRNDLKIAMSGWRQAAIPMRDITPFQSTIPSAGPKHTHSQRYR